MCPRSDTVICGHVNRSYLLTVFPSLLKVAAAPPHDPTPKDSSVTCIEISSVTRSETHDKTVTGDYACTPSSCLSLPIRDTCDSVKYKSCARVTFLEQAANFVFARVKLLLVLSVLL